MESAIITGGTSFIGASLVSELLRQGVMCYVIVRPESRNLSALPEKNPAMHLVMGNASEPEKWIYSIPRCDAFFHFAWDGVGAEGRANTDIQKKNVQMTMNCLRAASEIGCKRFIFAGSQAEYGICDELITEQTSCHPVIEYGKGKLEVLRKAKEISRNLGIEYAHLRIFSVYGPNDHPWTLVSRCLDAFLQNEKIPLSSCTQDWNFLYLTDAAEAIACFGDCSLNENDPVYNVAGEETLPLMEYVETMKTICGAGTPCYGERGDRIERSHGIHPDIKKMLMATNWRMKTDFESGIRKMLEIRGIRT